MCGVVVSEQMMVTLSLTEREHRLVRVWSSVHGVLLREFFEEAFSRFVDERSADDGRPQYLAVPSDAKAVCTKVEAEAARGIRQAAEVDRASYVDAYYTAVKEHLVRLADEDGALLKSLICQGERA